MTAALTVNICLSKLPHSAFLPTLDDAAETRHQWLSSSARSAILSEMGGRPAE